MSKSKSEFGKTVIFEYKRKPYCQLRCGGCKKPLVQLEKGVTFTTNGIPISHCGKIRVL